MAPKQSRASSEGAQQRRAMPGANEDDSSGVARVPPKLVPRRMRMPERNEFLEGARKKNGYIESWILDNAHHYDLSDTELFSITRLIEWVLDNKDPAVTGSKLGAYIIERAKGSVEAWDPGFAGDDACGVAPGRSVSQILLEQAPVAPAHVPMTKPMDVPATPRQDLHEDAEEADATAERLEQLNAKQGGRLDKLVQRARAEGASLREASGLPVEDMPLSPHPMHDMLCSLCKRSFW